MNLKFSHYLKVLFLNQRLKLLTLLTLSILIISHAHAQIGDVLWEENFNTLNTDYWTKNIGDGCDIGLCGWGNAELEYYSPSNVTIEPVPGESGNNALVLEAKNESAGSQLFTSGKVDTDGKVSIHYGLIEVRVRVPDLQTGLWPAAWLLGDVNLPWPAKGEIDIMEMGHAVEERNRQGHSNTGENHYVGANAIWQSSDGGYASLAWDVNYNQPYVASQSLSNRFVIYRLYWEPTSMRFTVIDQGVEYDLYANPFPIDAAGETAAFTQPFYLLLNLAVGGNFTDAAVPSEVTAPLPAKMYVDYIRVSQYNGHGRVAFSDGRLVAETGTFGVFTETTATNNQLDFSNGGAIYAWGETIQGGAIPAYEGSEVIAWETTNPNSWFGGGIVSLQGSNLSGFVEKGSLTFKIKIPGDISFKIGVTDNYTNESYVNFPAGQTNYGLLRNGEWGHVEIPLADLAGAIAFQDLNYLFAIISDDVDIPSSRFQLAIDDIVYDDGNAAPVLSSITVSPSNVTINEGETQQFFAQGYDQHGNLMDAGVSWAANGGLVSSTGLYTASEDGAFIITASSGSVNSTASVSVSSVPVRWTIPGRIEAENFNRGGQGIGYFDTTSGNTGGAFRHLEDVDIQATSDNQASSYNIGWIEAGEWLAYDVITVEETYDFKFSVASPNGNGQFHIEIDGIDVTGLLNVPNTGGWQNYATISAKNIHLTAGNHLMRVVFDAPGLNLNFIETSLSTGDEQPGNCAGGPDSGDYTYLISDDSTPTITFKPGFAGVASNIVILYYSTHPTGTYPGYIVSPNQAFALNGVNRGETIYFYYTYSVPEGGERNTSDDKHRFTLGHCI